MSEFIKYLQKKDFTQSTQKSILRTVNDFFSVCKTEDINVNKKDILKYLEHLRKEKKQNTTINIYLRSLKYYFAFLIENEQIISNPTNLIKIRGIKRHYLHKIFTVEELTQLADDYYNMFVKSFDNNYKPTITDEHSNLSKQRNYCMFTFLIYQGLHTNELQRIKLEDIDLIKATLKIAASKRTNARTLKLRAEQIGVLMHYTQNIRPKLLEHYTEETEQFFLLSRKLSVKHGNLFNRFKIQIQSINLDFTSFRQIRASVITHWIQSDGLRKAQYYAGHRYTSSTENYLPNDIEQLSDDIEKFNPF
jgi:integrase/recombinase XerC